MDRDIKPMVYFIGNTHYDPVWLWTWDEALASIRSTFRSALDRMNEYPDYTYSFCTPAVFEMIEKVDPGLFEEIKRRVSEGRWELQEGWWLQPDCGLALGESYVRQGLYGQRYLKEKFGKYSHIMFNIDSFGHSDMLPQILRGCGIDSYVFSRPESYHVELPDKLFVWRSPDGSTVTAYRAADLYQHTPDEVVSTAEKYIKEAAETGADRFLVYGVTNHGGAPTKAILSALEKTAESEKYAAFGSLDEFFLRQRELYNNVPGSITRGEGKELPVVDGGINTRDCGVFSNFSEIKTNNRRAEYTALAAERASVMASFYGEEYPLNELCGIWKDIMFNQFHDILGGASIMQAYRDARDLHGRALQNASEIMNFSLQCITRRINTGDGFWNYVYFNFNLSPYHGELEAELQWAWEYDLYEGGIEVRDNDGHVIPCQIILERSTIPGFRARVAFVGDIPAFGYAVYHFTQKKDSDGTHKLGGDASRLETERFEIDTCGDGGGMFIKDKITGKHVSVVPEVYEDEGDVWSFNTCGFGGKLEAFKHEESFCTERGNIISTVRTRSVFRKSSLEQHITVYPGEGYVDIRFRANWEDPHTVLKYTVRQNNLKPDDKIYAGVPGGKAVRTLDGFEYPLTETLSYGGVSVASGNIFAYDTLKDDGTFRLTVLRNPVCGDLRMEKALSPDEDYRYVGRGITEGTVRFYFDAGDAYGKALNEAYEGFLFAPVSVCEAKHGGVLSGTGSFLSFEGDRAISLDALKKAEDGSDDFIMRLSNRSSEYTAGKLYVRGSSWNEASIQLAPYENRTLRIGPNFDLRCAVKVNMLEE